MTPLVLVRDLRVETSTERGIARILRGVDLDICRGHIVGLIGESGCGKSTFALALLGLLPVNTSRFSGRIEIDGTDLAGLPQQEFEAWRGRRLAMVFQDAAASLNPVFTIAPQLLEVLRRRERGVGTADAWPRLRDALAQAEMTDPDACLRTYPHELSTGMQQRVMIAMVLLARPDLLVVDEPTAALDAVIEAEIGALLLRVRSEWGVSILFISHNLGLVARLCDEIAVMYGGLIVERGPASDVLGAPRHPYTKAFVACDPSAAIAGDFVSIAGVMLDPRDTAPGCVFASRCGLAEDRCHIEPAMMRTVRSDRRVACWKAF